MEELANITNIEGFWAENEKSEEILKKKNYLEHLLEKYKFFENNKNLYKELFELSENDAEMLTEINNSLKLLFRSIDNFEMELMFDEEEDKNNCFLEINTGVGGTDACDFSHMLLQMYIRWCQNNNYNVKILNIQNGDEAGISNAVIQINGENAFGWLKNESGIHRLVRISPYNANGKRQTSFSSVWVYPIVDSKINIDINENDLKIDTYRSSGAGGQHINKTDSAVRITHIPTKIVVQCQTQRSQHQNKEEAMKMLKSRLYELEREKRLEEKNKINNKKTNNGWSYQIRSYFLNPKQLIKDLRTGYEVNNFEKMMNGDYLTDFMKSYIKYEKTRDKINP